MQNILSCCKELGLYRYLSFLRIPESNETKSILIMRGAKVDTIQFSIQQRVHGNVYNPHVKISFGEIQRHR